MLDIPHGTFLRLHIPIPPNNLAARGITAYLEKPAKRLRPNERFLQNTLGNVRSGTWSHGMSAYPLSLAHIHPLTHPANKRAEEDEMWERRSLQRARESSSRRSKRAPSRSPSPASSSSQSSKDASPSTRLASHRHPHQEEHHTAAAPDTSPAGGLHEEDMQAWLAQRRVRGRGGVGSLVDDEGGAGAEQPGGEQGGRETHAGLEGVCGTAEGGRVKKRSSGHKDTRVESKTKKSKKKKRKKKKKQRRQRSSSPSSSSSA